MILDRNYRSRYGEIDIIASSENEITFIEVKTRLNNKMGSGAEKVDYRKINKMLMVAKKYSFENRLLNHRLRFDIIEVIKKNEKIEINHIKNILI